MNILSSLLNFIGSKLITTNVTPNINVTQGQLVNAWCRRYGNIVSLRLQVKNAANVSPGGNIFEGNISNVRPATGSSASSYQNSCVVVGQMGSTGNILARALSASYTANSNIYLTFCYVVGG